MSAGVHPLRNMLRERRQFAELGFRARSLFRRLPWLPALLAGACLLVLGQIISPGYASWTNVNNILAASAVLAVAAIGQTLVMVSGNFGIDLSVGEVMSLTAVLAYVVMNGSNGRIWLALTVVLVAGAALGMVNGTGIAFFGVPPLVMTLGMMVVAQGMIFAYTQGGTPQGNTAPLMLKLGLNDTWRVRWLTIAGIAIFVVAHVALKRSRYGRMLYLVGSNREAAKLAGIPVRRYVLVTYMLSGLFSGLAGMLLLSFAGTANLDLGGAYLLPTIAAVVIGGTSLAGGEGSLVRTALGAITFEILTTVLLVLGWNEAQRDMVTGGLLLVLVLFNARLPRLRI